MQVRDVGIRNSTIEDNIQSILQLEKEVQDEYGLYLKTRCNSNMCIPNHYCLLFGFHFV